MLSPLSPEHHGRHPGGPGGGAAHWEAQAAFSEARRAASHRKPAGAQKSAARPASAPPEALVPAFSSVEPWHMTVARLALSKPQPAGRAEARALAMAARQAVLLAACSAVWFMVTVQPHGLPSKAPRSSASGAAPQAPPARRHNGHPACVSVPARVPVCGRRALPIVSCPRALRSMGVAAVKGCAQ